MEAIILAGGLGTRLRQAVNNLPKCMAPVCGKPFAEYWLRYLSNYDVEKVIFSLGYKAQTVIQWIEKIQSGFPFEITYLTEQQPLGTGGAIRYALQETDSQDILILNGDSIFLAPIDTFLLQYKEKNPPLAVALKQMENFDRYGTVKIDGNNIITSFEEKKNCQKGFINTGIYILNKEKLNLNQQPEQFSFEKQILEKRNDICGFVYDGYFIDIGVPQDFYRAQTELKDELNTIL